MTAGKCVKNNPDDPAGGSSTTLEGFICKLNFSLYLFSGIFQTTRKIFFDKEQRKTKDEINFSHVDDRKCCHLIRQKADMKGKTRNKGKFSQRGKHG